MSQGGSQTGHASGLTAGMRLGRYEVVKRLATGGMAQLHLARSRASGGVTKLVVLKTILPHVASDPAYVKMFLREARISALLDHPCLVGVSDFGEEDGLRYYAMEYVHGADLRTILKGHGRRPVPLECAIAIAVGAAEGLHFAHELKDGEGRPRGLVHRDVSPSNILLTADGHVKVTDFGIAKAIDSTDATRSGTIKGKAPYMSPEQSRGHALDRRSDVFSLGVVLYELVTGRRPFAAPDDLAVMLKITRGEFEPPSNVVELPRAVETVIMRALRVDPDQRFATAAEFKRALEDVAHALHLRATATSVSELIRSAIGELPPPDVVPDVEATTVNAPETPLPDAVPPPARRRSPVVLAAAVLAVGGLAIALVIAAGSREEAAAVPVAAPAVRTPRTPDEPPSAEPGPAVSAAEPVPSPEADPEVQPKEEEAEEQPSEADASETRPRARRKAKRKATASPKPSTADREPGRPAARDPDAMFPGGRK